MSVKQLAEFVDGRGKLVSIEFNSLPFIPQRIFWITDVPVGTIRGKHAHYKTEQFVICVEGQVEIYVENLKYILNKNDSIYIPYNTYSKQEYTKENTILLVFASLPYDKKDYYE